MAAFETIAYGFGLLEGPRVDEQNRLYFSDVPNGGIYRRHEDGKIETLIAGRKGVGGIAFNEGGGIVFSGKTLGFWNEATGQSRDLLSEWDGHPFKTLNDLQPDSRGSVFVGSIEYDIATNEPPVPGSLFRVDPDGRAVKLWDDIFLSNGMGFSPDGKLLYHSDSMTRAVWVYDVTPQHTLTDRRIFAKTPDGFPDGLTMDAEGGIFVAVVKAGEIQRFRPDGTLDRRIKVPASFVTSVTFGGKDLADLYVVTANNGEDKSRKGTIFRMRSDIPGAPVPKARFK